MSSRGEKKWLLFEYDGGTYAGEVKSELGIRRKVGRQFPEHKIELITPEDDEGETRLVYIVEGDRRQCVYIVHEHSHPAIQVTSTWTTSVGWTK